MPTRTGLRTEIVVSTVLLLGAALLFAGFLLVKLTEGELLAERRLSLQRTARLLAAGDPTPEVLSGRLLALSRDGELRAWRLLADDFTPRLSFSQGGAALLAELPAVGPESAAGQSALLASAPARAASCTHQISRRPRAPAPPG